MRLPYARLTDVLELYGNGTLVRLRAACLKGFAFGPASVYWETMADIADRVSDILDARTDPFA